MSESAIDGTIAFCRRIVRCDEISSDPAEAPAVLAGLLLAVSLRAAHELVGAAVLPVLVRDLGGEAWTGAFFTVFGLAAAAGLVAGGRASDAWGPLRPLAAGLLVFAVGMTGTGLAPSMPAVVLARAVEGFGGGVVTAVVSAAVMLGYDVGARPRVLAWLSAAWVVPGLLAPALAVAVAEAFGWRAVFLGLAPLVVLSAALVLPPLARQRPGSWPAGAGRIEATAPAAEGSGLSGSRGSPSGGGRPGLLRASLTVRALLVFAFFGVESFLPLALRVVRGTGPAPVAALLTLSALGWTTGAFAQARVWQRISPVALTRAGVLGVLAGIACAIGTLAGWTPVRVVLAGWTVAGLGMGLGYNAATASAMQATRPGAEGATGTALGLVDALAAAVATGLGGAFLAAAPLAAGVVPGGVVATALAASAAGAGALSAASRLAAETAAL
jgi:MFS family permease